MRITTALVITNFLLAASTASAQSARPAAPTTARPAQQSYASLIAAGYMPPSVQVQPFIGTKVKVTFNYTPDDPTVSRVFLAGTFNDWKENNLPMVKSGKSFQRQIELEVGAHEYKFVTIPAGGKPVWKDDPLNQLNTDDFNGGRNSLLLISPPAGGGAPGTAAGGNTFANKGEPIRWEIDVATAQRKALDERKGVLVFFSSSSATSSRFIEDNVFTDGRVRDMVKRYFVPLRIDMQLQAELARRMGVPRGGVVAVYDVGGSRILGVVDRPATPEILINKVTEVVQKARQAAAVPAPLPQQ